MKCSQHDLEYEENSHCIKCVQEEVLQGVDLITLMGQYDQLYALAYQQRLCLLELIEAHAHVGTKDLRRALRKAQGLVSSEFPPQIRRGENG